jgi:protein-S-isoprenylcysteine O-methyltransferase Ste14
MKPKDNPGVYIPPPLIYAAIFVSSVFLQKKVAIDDSLFQKQFTIVAGIIFFILALFFIGRSLLQFVHSKNTVLTIKAASSLQTTGIYQITRNPMYLGLVIVYLGLTCFIGNWWNIIFLPLLLFIIQEHVIKREEKYLARRFDKEYSDYKQEVRRWL